MVEVFICSKMNCMQEAEVQGWPEAEGLISPPFGERLMTEYPLISTPVEGRKRLYVYTWVSRSWDAVLSVIL